MFCTRCGARLEPNQSYCPSCGAPVGAPAPLTPPQGRVAGHIRLLGILWLVISAIRLIPGIVLLSVFNPHRMGVMMPDVPLFVPGLLRMAGGLLIAGGALGLIAGWGLLARQSWARVLAIVLGFLSLLDVPFGTALGIYTLWVLLPASSDQEYRRVARL